MALGGALDQSLDYWYPLVVSALQIALMLGLAIASYRWIETPLRKGYWFGKRWKTLVVGGGVLVTLSGLVALSKPLKGNYTAAIKQIVSANLSTLEVKLQVDLQKIATLPTMRKMHYQAKQPSPMNF